MPLLVIVGWPSSGKTTVANRIVRSFQEQGKNCELVSDEYLLQKEERNQLFRDSRAEKENFAGRSLRPDVLVVLDSMNYIKGYRYELYCLSKEHKTTHCVVEIVVDTERVLELNRRRAEGDRYEEQEQVMQMLMNRYEAPDSRNRWDSPLVPVIDGDIGMQQIEAALFGSRLDGKSREVVQLILKAQDSGSCGTVAIPDLRSAMTLDRAVSSIELNKLRRQFINYNKTHPAASDQQIVGNFVQFIQSNVTDSH